MKRVHNKLTLQFNSRRVQRVYKALQPHYLSTYFKNTQPFSASTLAKALGLHRSVFCVAGRQNAIALSTVMHMELLLSTLKPVSK